MNFILALMLFAGIFMWCRNNVNESDRALARGVAADTICYDNFKNPSSYSYNKNDVLTECLNQSRADNDY